MRFTNHCILYIFIYIFHHVPFFGNLGWKMSFVLGVKVIKKKQKLLHSFKAICDFQ